MRDGLLGYWGSRGFSAAAVLASLRACARRRLDLFLGGHHFTDRNPGRWIAQGIARGEADLWAAQMAAEAAGGADAAGGKGPR